MRSNIVILLVMAAYFTVADIAYAIWTYIDTGAVEPIGTAAIGLLVVLSIFIAVPFAVVAVVGFVFEYDRFSHAH